jgi:hypothetical protein
MYIIGKIVECWQIVELHNYIFWMFMDINFVALYRCENGLSNSHNKGTR